MTDDKIIDKIAKLLAQAEHPNTSDVERDTFLAKADAMMLQHAIDEAQVRASQSPNERRKPVRVDVQLFDTNTVYGNKMRVIAGKVARVLGVSMAYSSRENMCHLIGFSEDVSWMQMLFLNIQSNFVSKIRPRWNDELSLSENVAAFRESGVSWGDVSKIAHQHGAIDDYDRKGEFAQGDKLAALYKAHCKAKGTQPITITRHKAYRHTFTEAFTNRIMARLEEMQEARRGASSGFEVVLYDAAKAVEDMFYEEFPHLDPKMREEEMARLKEQQRIADEAHALWLESLSPAELLRYEKQQAAEREKQTRENERYWRRQDKLDADRWDGRGAVAGRAAADGVNLSTAEGVTHHTKGELS